MCIRDSTFIVLSVILTQLVVNGLKLTTGVLRPDATNYFSFPSGHTAALRSFSSFMDDKEVLFDQINADLIAEYGMKVNSRFHPKLPLIPPNFSPNRSMSGKSCR